MLSVTLFVVPVAKVVVPLPPYVSDCAPFHVSVLSQLESTGVTVSVRPPPATVFTTSLSVAESAPAGVGSEHLERPARMTVHVRWPASARAGVGACGPKLEREA